MIAVLLKIFGPAGTVALAAAVLLALTTAGTGLMLYKARSDVASAKAKLSLVESARDAAANRAVNNATAAAGWETVATERNTLLAACQLENTRILTDNKKAVAAARAAATDAERTLSLFVARYSENLRNPDCVRARAALDLSCPALEF